MNTLKYQAPDAGAPVDLAAAAAAAAAAKGPTLLTMFGTVSGVKRDRHTPPAVAALPPPPAAGSGDTKRHKPTPDAASLDSDSDAVIEVL